MCSVASKGVVVAVSLTEETLRDFAASLAAKEPVPGGGGAAAYAGALGVALAAMTGVYTVGKRSYAEHEADIRRLLARAEHIRVSLDAAFAQSSPATENPAPPTH